MAAYYPPPQPQTTTVTVIQQSRPPPPRPVWFGEHPVSLTCPYCGRNVKSRTKYTSGSHARCVCCIIACVGCFLMPPLLLGCCLIPCCCTSCQDVVHTCPVCNREAGRFKRTF